MSYQSLISQNSFQRNTQASELELQAQLGWLYSGASDFRSDERTSQLRVCPANPQPTRMRFLHTNLPQDANKSCHKSKVRCFDSSSGPRTTKKKNEDTSYGSGSVQRGSRSTVPFTILRHRFFFPWLFLATNQPSMEDCFSFALFLPLIRWLVDDEAKQIPAHRESSSNNAPVQPCHQPAMERHPSKAVDRISLISAYF